MKPDSAALPWDALNSASSIQKYLDGISEDAYLHSQMRRRAVEREFEIIGEAPGKLRRTDPDTSDE